MTEHPDTIRVARCRALLAVKGPVTRAALRHALDDPIPAPTPEPQQPPSERPGPGNTGVPVGTKLNAHPPVVITKDGDVLDGLDITGTLTIKADNVTIRRCRIRATGGYAVKVADSSYTGLVIEDTEIDGNGKATLCVGTKNYTLRRCNVHGAAGDLLRADGNVLVEDSWLHGIVRVEGGHHDAVQMLKGSDVTLRRNTIDIAQPKPDGTVDYMNACFIISAGAPVDRILIEGNYLNGGNYALYLGANDKNIPVTNVIARDNTFGPDVRPRRGITARGSALTPGNYDLAGKSVT